MSKLPDAYDQTRMLEICKAEAEREVEIAELEFTAKSALWRLSALIGRAKAVQFVREEFTSSKIVF